MLFTITTWIIVLTLLGIVAVYAFRLCCVVSVAGDRKGYRESPKQQPAPESNHYEPLNLQLNKIAANDVNQTDGKQDSGISVAESTLSETKSVEIGVPDEKKPLNTEPESEALQEVTVSVQSGSELKRSVERSSVVVLEVRKNEQTLPASVGGVVNPSVDSGGSISLPAVAKVVNVTTAVAPAAAAVVVVDVDDQNAVSHKSTRDTTVTPGVIAAELQPYNSEIPMPYVEVESATLPRLSNSNEAVKEIGMPSA